MWRKLNGERLSEDIVAEVEKTILHEKAMGSRLKVCIGSDSQVYGNTIEYATVIVFVREQRGGFMFIRTDSQRAGIGLKERMLNEVGKSIEIAYKLCDVLDKYNIDLEVHADINTNPHFKSNTALSEAMGYILSMGFIFKAKPEAFASSYCANKIVN